MRKPSRERDLTVAVQAGGEPMAEFRRRAYATLGFVTVPVILPFAMANCVAGCTGLGVVILVVAAFGLLNKLSIHRGGGLFLPCRALYLVILGCRRSVTCPSTRRADSLMQNATDRGRWCHQTPVDT